MKRFSEVLGMDKMITLAETRLDEEVPSQKTVKATPVETRVSRDELETTYKRDPITRSAILKSVQAIMAAGYKLQCSNQDILNYFQNFIDNVGKVGEKITFDDLLERTWKHELVFGPAYWETVPSKHVKNFDNIVDLLSVDPKRMDYAKDSSGEIMLDNFGMPRGYVQTIPYGKTAVGDPTPKDISLMPNQIFLLPGRICEFKFDTIGDGFYPLGVIEPAYKSILRKQNIEMAQANSIFQRGTSPLVDYVGDEFHEPTPQQIENATKNLAKLQFNRFMAFPKWHKIESVSMKETGAAEKTLKYLREDQSASLLMAMAIATGVGESTNRSTLATQLKFTEYCLNGMVKRTLATIRKYVFARICDYNKFDEVPRIIWGNIDVEEVNDKMKRLVEAVKAGIILPQQASNYVLSSEGLI